MLDLATGTVDGRNVAASTARRHRMILANAMDYALELGLIETNPIRALKWTAPKVSSQVDRRSVVNPHQARALLDAVRAQQPSGPRLVAFFAVMYYAGLRPEGAINLSAENIILPPRGPSALAILDLGTYCAQRAADDSPGPHTAAQNRRSQEPGVSAGHRR